MRRSGEESMGIHGLTKSSPCSSCNKSRGRGDRVSDAACTGPQGREALSRMDSMHAMHAKHHKSVVP